MAVVTAPSTACAKAFTAFATVICGGVGATGVVVVGVVVGQAVKRRQARRRRGKKRIRFMTPIVRLFYGCPGYPRCAGHRHVGTDERYLSAVLQSDGGMVDRRTIPPNAVDAGRSRTAARFQGNQSSRRGGRQNSPRAPPGAPAAENGGA